MLWVPGDARDHTSGFERLMENRVVAFERALGRWVSPWC